MSDPKQIFDSYQELKTLTTVNSGLDLELAKQLSYLKEKGHYKVIMGFDDASWKSFISQPELQPLTLYKADRLVKIYTVYIIKFGLAEKDLLDIDSNSLLRLSTVVNANNVRSWLQKAKSLSRSDLRRQITYGEVDELHCHHEFVIKTTKTCKICGMKANPNKNAST